MIVPAGGYHVVLNEQNRDIPLLEAKYPFLEAFEIEVDLLTDYDSRKVESPSVAE